MDDGGHGTHVAGIAAGNDPKTLVGIAPGAKILSAKLGDGRFIGGPTTTASMLLAIDYAVANKADLINMSYGCVSAFNDGGMAIEQYVNKIALEKGMIFVISAGNEGPQLFTVGSPTAATLAISVGAYLSPEMASELYGSLGTPEGTLFNFSSIGPRADGGSKPNVIAPGSAFASTPQWQKVYGKKNGTSMAAPQVAGGVALLLSAAKQKSLLTDRATVSYALQQSAKPVKSLHRMEQGHGLVNVSAAFDLLAKTKAKVAEYGLSVSPSALAGKPAKGILIRNGVIRRNLMRLRLRPSVRFQTTSGGPR